MGTDRPLTAFTDAERDSGDTKDGSDGDDTAATVGDETTTKAEPPAATYRWQPDGVACTRCGATTKRQWHDDDAFVCAGCKSW